MQIYHGLAASSTPLPKGALQSIYDWGKNHKDVDLLAKLTKRTDLPANILANLAKMNTAKIRVAYLSRKDVTAAELAAVIGKEKRVSVLAVVAESVEAPPKVLKLLGGTESIKVNLALLKNVNTPEQTLTNALRELWSSGGLGEDSAHTLEELPHTHNVAALNLDAISSVNQMRTTWRYLGVKVIASAYLTKEAELNLVDALVVQPSQDATFPGHQVVRNIFMLLERPTLNSEAITLIESSLEGIAKRFTMFSGDLYRIHSLIKTRTDNAKLAEEATELLQAARKATSAKEVDTLAATALRYAQENSSGRLCPELVATFDALSINGHTETSTLLSLIPHIAHPYMPSQVIEKLIDLHAGNDIILTEILARFDVYLSADILPKLTNPTAVVDELAKRISGVKPSDQIGFPYRWEQLLALGCISKKGLWSMPITLVTDTSEWAATQYAAAFNQVEELMCEYLGENSAAWEVFATLTESSDKTFGEILETVALLLPKSNT